MTLRASVIALLSLACACSGGAGGDGGARDASGIDAAVDASAIDAGAIDAGSPPDGGAPRDDASADGATPIEMDASTDAGAIGDAGSPPDAGPIPATCPWPVEVVVYDQSAWNVLADAFAADPSPCAHYWLSIPAVTSDKTQPRAGGAAAGIRARGSRFHAMAEFHWTSWSAVAGPWYDKGVEFRRRMEAAGYDLAAGDTWAINELPSSVRSDATVRQHVRDVVRGLHDGPAGAAPVEGAVFTVGLGQGTVNFSVYKPNLEDWIEDAAFWVDVNGRARWWGQEVYADPDYVCVGGTTVAGRSRHVNDYTQHLARLTAAGPATANTAQSYFSRAYTPMLNAVWRARMGYGNTMIPLDAMKSHVSTQVYAARAWASSHAYPDGRIGFAWARQPGVTDADLAELAARLAAASHGAYDDGGGSAARACSPSGAFTWCACDVAGASFNEGWTTFASW